MKMIVKTDFLLQTCMVLAWVLLAVAEGFGGKALLAGMILLNWQIMSSLMMILFRARYRTECIVFLVAAVTFQVLINSLFVVAPELIGPRFMIVVSGVPPVVSGSYYLLTIFSLARRRSHKGKFLPHTSF
jgi:hypothetical protein